MKRKRNINGHLRSPEIRGPGSFSTPTGFRYTGLINNGKIEIVKITTDSVIDHRIILHVEGGSIIGTVLYEGSLKECISHIEKLLLTAVDFYGWTIDSKTYDMSLLTKPT